MPCARCWRIVGEDYRCLDHGGESAWTVGAFKQPTRKLSSPREPIDVHDPWFDFLDVGEKVVSEVTP